MPGLRMRRAASEGYSHVGQTAEAIAEQLFTARMRCTAGLRMPRSASEGHSCGGQGMVAAIGTGLHADVEQVSTSRNALYCQAADCTGQHLRGEAVRVREWLLQQAQGCRLMLNRCHL